MKAALRRDITVLTILAVILGSALLLPTLLFYLFKHAITHRGNK